MNREALEATIEACEALQRPQSAALVALTRWLAAEMDAKPNARLSQCYLSALKDIHRVVASAPVSRGSTKVAIMREQREQREQAIKLRSVT
ncbi:MAG TPA: hypothetical protein PK890_00315 [Terrimesophilobacter sp.]|nr:hypothetical protein [Terrimesophilobacter sp.]